MHIGTAPHPESTVLPEHSCAGAGPFATRKQRHALARRQTVRYDPAAPIAIECLRGTLWVTIDHDTQDLVLARGQWVAVFRGRPVLVTALEEATLQVRSIPGFRPRRSWRRRLAEILGSLAHRRRRP